MSRIIFKLILGAFSGFLESIPICDSTRPETAKNDAAFTAQTRLNKRFRAGRASRPKGEPGAIQITPRRTCRIKIQSPLSAKKFSLKSTELHAFTRHGLKKLKCVLPKIRPAQAHFLIGPSPKNGRRKEPIPSPHAHARAAAFCGIFRQGRAAV